MSSAGNRDIIVVRGLYAPGFFRSPIRKLGDDMTRRTLAVLWISFLVLSSCTRPDKASGNKSSADVGPPVDGDWAIVRFEAEPDTLNPLTHTSTNGSYTMYG